MKKNEKKLLQFLNKIKKDGDKPKESKSNTERDSRQPR